MPILKSNIYPFFPLTHNFLYILITIFIPTVSTQWKATLRFKLRTRLILMQKMQCFMLNSNDNSDSKESPKAMLTSNIKFKKLKNKSYKESPNVVPFVLTEGTKMVRRRSVWYQKLYLLGTAKISARMSNIFKIWTLIVRKSIQTWNKSLNIYIILSFFF